MFTKFAVFIFDEHNKIVNNMTLQERETLNLALETLKDKLALPNVTIIHKENEKPEGYDAVIQIMNIDFLCEIKTTVTNATVVSIINNMHKNPSTSKGPLLLVARYISPNIVEQLVANGISCIDCAGNCHIRYMKNNSMIFQLVNKGEKNPYASEKVYPIFQEAGLKVIFYLLQDSSNIGQPYRKIQDATNVSLGAIKNIFNVLADRNFILTKGKMRFLKNKKALLDLWVENYNQVLKPKLLMGRMAFRTNEQRNKWHAMELPEGMYWGGESAANMIDNYLEPGAFDIYTDVPTAYLMKTGFVKQDVNGEIKVYQKFWKWETEDHLAPLILVYADLMGSGNSRCLEAANRLIKYGLNDFE